MSVGRAADSPGWYGWIEHGDNALVMRRRDDAGDGALASSEETQSMKVT
jgi:hypothetical protein